MRAAAMRLTPPPPTPVSLPPKAPGPVDVVAWGGGLSVQLLRRLTVAAAAEGSAQCATMLSSSDAVVTCAEVQAQSGTRTSSWDVRTKLLACAQDAGWQDAGQNRSP